MEPVKMGSASVNRAGMENTAPLMAVRTDVMEMDSVFWVKTAGTVSAKLDGEAPAAVSQWRLHVQTTKTMKEMV